MFPEKNKPVDTALTPRYIHKVLQFLCNYYVDLVLTELVRIGHLGLGPTDLVLDTKLLQYLRYEKKSDLCLS
jgi:hypothetical protein